MYPNTVATQSVSTVRAFFNRTYSWMSAGLVLTAVIAYLTSTNENLLGLVRDAWLPLLLVQLGIVMGLSFLINRISAPVASVLFMLYAASMGLTMSTIFLRFTGTEITSAFAISAGMFGAMSLLGYTTKIDLTKFRSIMIMALIGVILAMLVNLWLQSSALLWIISIVGVILFAGLTAYDTQKLKAWASSGADTGTEMGERLAVFGALTLYLDFINMFYFLLNILGLARSSD